MIFNGHGGANAEVGSVLFTGIESWNEKTLERYSKEIESKAIGINQKGEFYLTSKFFDTYVSENAYDGNLFYLGSCSSAADERLMQSIWNKGARAIVGNTKTVWINYNLKMLYSFFEGLTIRDSEGEFLSISKALEYAKSQNGDKDPCIFGYGSEVWACYRDDFTLPDMGIAVDSDNISDTKDGDEYEILDNDNLVTQINCYYADGSLMNSLDFIYNDNSQLLNVKDQTDPEYEKTWTYFYDDAGRLLQIELSVPGSTFVLEEYHYDQSGRVESYTYVGEEETTEYIYFYDSQERLEKTVGENENATIVTEFEYDSQGKIELQYVTYTNNYNGTSSTTTTSFEYDDMGRKISEKTDDGSNIYQSTFRYDLEPFCVCTSSGIYSLWIGDSLNQFLWNIGVGEGELIIDSTGRLIAIRNDACYYEFCYGNSEDEVR